MSRYPAIVAMLKAGDWRLNLAKLIRIDGAIMQISIQNNLERNLLNKQERFQNPYTILRDRRAVIFNYALRLFALVLTTLFINTMSAEPVFSKENYYPKYSKENYDTRYSYEPARAIVYEKEDCKPGDQNVECTDNFLLSYLYYLWHWFWCNIILILIIAIIIWLLFRWYYSYRISQEFIAAAARLPVAGDLTVGNAQFLMGTLRRSLPL